MKERKEFVLRSLESENFRALCREYGISAKTGYKWRERFLKNGLEGMSEESRRPKSSPRGLAEGMVCDIIRIKQKHLSWGPRKVRAIYRRVHGQAPSESSFKRVLERAGYTQKRRWRRREEAGRLCTGRQAKTPNEIWTVDFKGWWNGAQGRCEPLTVRDEFSRYVLDLRALSDASGQSVRAAFERLFAIHGLPEAIRSDNGSPFANTSGLLGLTRLSAWWIALGIDLERGRPGHPQDNGCHERLHLDISRELEKQRIEQQAAFDEWRRTFNQERPHEALGLRTPAEIYRASAKKFAGTPEDLTYTGMESRRVNIVGNIRLGGQGYFISTALSGWSVGLEPAKEAGHWKVWFGRLLIGQIEEATAHFERAAPVNAPKDQPADAGKER